MIRHRPANDHDQKALARLAILERNAYNEIAKYDRLIGELSALEAEFLKGKKNGPWTSRDDDRSGGPVHGTDRLS